MAESKFLKYQDANGDNLIDICEIDLGPPEEQVCKDCVANPKAIVPNWKTAEDLAPFLNEKICQYQIPITTPETTTGADASSTEAEAQELLDGLFAKYANEAIESFLDYYDKAISEENINLMLADIDYRDYDLDPTPFSHLKLLYSFPFEILSKLEQEEEEEEDEPEGEDITVEYVASEMNPDLIRVRKGLNLYSRYEKVYRFTDGGTLRFVETGGLFTLSEYGDAGFFSGTSVTSNLLSQLDGFLNEKGFNIVGVGLGFFEDAVTKIEFTFSPKYKLKKMKVYSETCGDKPKVFKKSKLRRLNKKSAWKDETAVAYFAQMKKMERDLTARVPKPWLEFVKEYTYPKVDAVINSATTNTDPENSALSCIADNLAAEGKQLGQDILDDVFGIGDAIALQFHKALCNEDYREMLEQKVKLGQIPAAALEVAEQGRDVSQIDASKFVHSGEEDEATKNIGAFAIEQAFKELDERDQVFTNFCARLLSGAATGGGLTRQLDLLWANGLDKIRICGLFDLMLDAIQCLFKGLTLEEALASMIQAACKAMSIENFGDLFVGLPPDKQQELDALVQKKLSEGDIFRPDSQAQRVSDEASKGENARIDNVQDDPKLFVKREFKKPWENQELVSKQNQEYMKEGSYESMTPSGIPPASGRKSDVGDATVKAQVQNAGSELNPALVMDAYIAALIEVYSENLLDLLDILNKFPGAQIIAKVIALLDCPRPPIFDPSLMDFLKDIELPFCRNTYHIGLPRLENPFAWLPKIKDLLRILFYIIKIEIQKLVIRIIIKLIVKLCELIGNAICKALETVGDIAAALPDLATGRTTFRDVVADTICGPDADQEKIDDTIVDMFQKLGSAGAAFADRDAVMSFVEDLSASTTRKELSDAILGNPSETYLSVVESLTQFEHPQFAAAFKNREGISSFFGNIGNLMPAEARQAVRDFANGLDEDDELPANPTLCATPQQIEDFCNLRSGLLEGRASPDQIAKMCENARNTFKDDLEDLASILNDGVGNYIANNMPPLVSDPGCNNGLVPFEPEEISKASTNALDGNMEQLKLAYTYDMIGNGPLERNWGFMNMVLSDTMGSPYTRHVRKSLNSGGFLLKRKYVDFYVDPGDGGDDADEDKNFARISRQQGAFPLYVAGWLKENQMPTQFAASSFNSSNNSQDDKVFKKSFDDLNFDGLFGDVDLLALPDYGYNTDLGVNFEEERVKFTRKARKKDPDLEIKYRDNAKGSTKDVYSYGFSLKLLLSDIVKEEDEFVNRLDDNARIIITDEINIGANTDASNAAATEPDDDDSDSEESEALVLRYRKYEFLSTDNGLEGLDLTEYPRYFETGQKTKRYIPQVYLLQDIIEKRGATPPSAQSIKSDHDSAMDTIFKKFSEEVYNNDKAFKYGAEYDNLTFEQTEYGVVNDAGNFVDYATYADNNDLSNADAVLGVSKDQYSNDKAGTPEKTRVFYLDPAKHGGSYFNPPVYIKPVQNEGWLGFVDAMFPEMSPCKPYRTDVVDFSSIQDRINSTYSSIPEDERLKSDPDCVREEPYNRILERPAKAGIEGMISAAIRIFASIHLLKSSATFTKFKPDFRNTFSSLYAQYIIERMEEEFKDAQPSGFFEFFNPFKDEEFWYAFLEQSVQTYARRYANGDLPDPPGPIVDALNRIEKVINKHRQIYRDTYEANNGDTIIGLKDAKKLGDAGLFQTLKGYRFDKNLEVVKETEDDAKLILQELVIEELQFMGDIYNENMKNVGMVGDDQIGDIRKYILENLTAGSTLDIDKEIKEEVEDLPTEGEDHYTSGGTLITDDGEDYIGYYHIFIDEEGDPIYMAGSYHTEDEHETLRVSANKVVINIGEVSDEATPTSEKPFALEKYIRVNGTALKPSAALSQILASGDEDTNISDVFPGTMELVYDENGAEIGIQGELGVRYGLRFKMASGTLAEVEVDALDLPVTEFQPFDESMMKSKLFLCLINKLLDDPEFNAIVKYVFPLNKILSTIAIYNDMAFLPSIGEKTVDQDSDSDIESKPGRYVTSIDEAGVVQLSAGVPGWSSVGQRSPGIWGNGFFWLHYDKWDQNTLTKSKFRIKKLFKGFYNSRDFDANGDDSDGPGEALLASLRAAFKPASGQRLLPWWKRRLLRTNPFNADGALCSKKD